MAKSPKLENSYVGEEKNILNGNIATKRITPNLKIKHKREKGVANADILKAKLLMKYLTCCPSYHIGRR